MVCVDLSNMWQFIPLPYEAALDRAAMAGGWTITGHSLTFTGICPACAGK